MISVIVTNYNSAHTIEKCLRSILDNTFKDLEVIVIDDASTDNSVEVVKSIKDPRLRVVQMPVNKGAGNSRYVGINQESKGEYISLIDCDDYIEPDYYETLYNAAIESGAEIVISKLVDIAPIHTNATIYKDKVLSANQLLNSSLFSRRLANKVDYAAPLL